MATVVFLHAHPDDECVITGGTMARLVSEGHRVVLVVATDGGRGECPAGLLAPNESLGDRRRREVAASAQVLRLSEVRFLGYADSGMAGTSGNVADGAFCTADIDQVAHRLARWLRELRADVLVAYDENGGYGHPDHVHVHRVGTRAIELAGTPALYQATINRDFVLRVTAGIAGAPSPEEMATVGLPESAINTTVDVRDFTRQKQAAMRAHESQAAEMAPFLAMSETAFRCAFGLEWYVRVHGPAGTPNDHLI